MRTTPSRCAALVVLAIAASAVTLRAQSAPGPTLSGVVVDTLGNPIASAQVGVSTGASRIADDSGRFSIQLPQRGPIALSVRRVGFQAYQVPLTIVSDTTLMLVMKAVPTTLTTVRTDVERTVRALEIAGFYRRLEDRKRGVNSGWFITTEELEKRQATHTTNLLRGIPGIQVSHFRLRGYTWQTIVDLRHCPLSVYLDGVRLGPPPQFGSALAEPNIPADVDGVIPPRELAGVEIYSGMPPVGYETASGHCGVVLFWTR